jgi:hypothetical protein
MHESSSKLEESFAAVAPILAHVLYSSNVYICVYVSGLLVVPRNYQLPQCYTNWAGI